MFITRFAPSPTGYLHLGHVYSAYTAYQKSLREEGKFLLRIEDIDTTRCRPCYTQSIYEDLHWLGIHWDKEAVLIQSEHFPDYNEALSKLDNLGLIYRCYCSRREIKEQFIKTFGNTNSNGNIIYTGTCRNRQPLLDDDTRHFSYRLNIEKAVDYLGGRNMYWQDLTHGTIKVNPFRFGDVILARKDCPTSYYVACTVDDARQNITCVIRGKDLFEATDIQVLLQNLLGLPTPLYYHHSLIYDHNGQKLSKRLKSTCIKSFREQGISPTHILQSLGF